MTSVSICVPSRVKTFVCCSPATTCAFVTMMPGAATKPVPSCTRSHAVPSTFTTELLTRCATSAGTPCCGGDPASGDVSVSKTSGNVSSPTRRPSVSASGGGSGAMRSIARDSRVAHRPCRPTRGARDAGISNHITASTPVTPTIAPATRSLCASRCWRAHAQPIVHGRADSRSRSRDRWSRSAARTRARRAGGCGAEARSASARLSTSTIARMTPPARPAHDATRAARNPCGSRSNPPRPWRSRGDRGSSRARREQACVGRKPVCATIRWSGRTDWPSTCQVRCSTSSVSIMPNADPASSSRRRARPGRSWAGRRA